ncbi:MAG: hypothetical protein DMD81_13615 [Candidatus Rokuibacteriota bacterium]|nr:MAG: hypothetical protein DMD81_13615 [Candidatus Rokubacteria bacterium]
MNGFARIALTAVTTTGKYAGRQPAMTALTASVRIVASPQRGGIGPSETSGSRSVAASIRATRSPVGATMGRPSVHPSRANRSKIASGSSSTVKRSTPPAARSVRVAAVAVVRALAACSRRLSSVATFTIAPMTGSARRRISG